jgi:hypothetical protein
MIYGISLLAHACYVSIIHEELPVTIGRQVYSNVNLVSLVPAKGEDTLTHSQLIGLKGQLLWSHSIIKRSFPQEREFKCIISHPDWMGFLTRNDIHILAHECGLSPISMISNTGALGYYADQLLGSSKSELWLSLIIDHNAISASVQVIEEGIVEVLSTESTVDSSASSNIEKRVALVKQSISSACNKAKINPSDINHCIIYIDEDKCDENIRNVIGSLIGNSPYAILHENSAVALGTAIQTGVSQGNLPRLLLDVLKQSIHISIESDMPINALLLDETIRVGEHYCIIPSNTIYPTKRSATLRLRMPGGCTTGLNLYESSITLSGEKTYSHIGITELSNASSNEVDLLFDLNIDIDAYPRIRNLVTVTVSDETLITVKRGLLLCSKQDISIQIVTDSPTSNNKTNIPNEKGLDCEHVLVLTPGEAAVMHHRTLVINEDETISLKIPSGVRENSLLRIHGKGNIDCESGKRGDLYLRIKILDDEISESDEVNDPETTNFIELVRSRQSLQTREILERIITAEKQRIGKENALWGFIAGGAAIAFGIGDGLNIGDLGLAIGGFKGGSLVHKFASKEQIEFLQKIQSAWMITDRSPLDIRRRLGEPIARFIGVNSEDTINMYNIHQSTARGIHIVELDFAGNVSEGFTNEAANEILVRTFNSEELALFSNQLYPSTVTPLKMLRVIQPKEAMQKDPYYEYLKHAGEPYRVIYRDDSEQVVYKIPIPDHSDF